MTETDCQPLIPTETDLALPIQLLLFPKACQDGFKTSCPGRQRHHHRTHPPSDPYSSKASRNIQTRSLRQGPSLQTTNHPYTGGHDRRLHFQVGSLSQPHDAGEGGNPRGHSHPEHHPACQHPSRSQAAGGPVSARRRLQLWVPGGCGLERLGGQKRAGCDCRCCGVQDRGVGLWGRRA